MGMLDGAGVQLLSAAKAGGMNRGDSYQPQVCPTVWGRSDRDISILIRHMFI